MEEVQITNSKTAISVKDSSQNIVKIYLQIMLNTIIRFIEKSKNLVQANC